MNDLRQAAEMALEVLLKYRSDDAIQHYAGIQDSITFLRQALAQPEREWVGLTDDERKQIVSYINDPVAWVPAVEAKLKEKNT
jgi:hypothetical protein